MHKRYFTLAAMAVAAMAISSAVPSDGQTPGTTTAFEVSEVSGGAVGLAAEVRSDLLVPPSPATIQALVQAAADNDDAAAAQALESASIDASDPAVGAEAVLFGVGPLPEVTLPAEGGGPFTDSLASLDLDGFPVAGLLDVSTEGALGPDGFATSSSTVAEYDLLGLLGGEAVSTECSADLEVAEGSTTLLNAGGIISGPFVDDPAPNTPSPFNTDTTFPISIDGTTLTVEYVTTLNEQVTNGTELTVNGLHTFLSIRVDPEGPGVGDPELVLIELESIASQSRCGVVEAAIVEPPAPGPGPGPIPATPPFTG